MKQHKLMAHDENQKLKFLSNRSRKYKCDDCDSRFYINSHLKRHVKGVHLGINDEKKHLCEICDTAFSRPFDLNRHIRRIHEAEENQFPCDMCKNSFSRQANLNLHKKKVHQGIKYNCHLCEKQFSRKRDLKNHVDGIHKGIRKTCEICQKDFIGRNLYSHMRSVHQKGTYTYQCKLCEKTFINNHHLLRHVKNVHEGLRNYKCSKCEKAFRQRITLTVHIKRCHDLVKDKNCDICKQSFSCKQNLEKHIETVHEGLKKFKCNFENCDKAFSHKSHLQQHKTSVHDKIRRYNCDKCDSKFYKNDSLKRHLIVVHNQRPCKNYFTAWSNLKCSTCNKVYRDTSEFKNHILTQHEGYRFDCPYCDTVFSWKNTLNRHIRINHQEGRKARYPCDMCKNSFTALSNLTHHKKRVHEDFKTIWNCTICKKEFSSRKALRRHKKMAHEKIEKYCCTICDKKFSFSQILKNHIRVVHEELKEEKIIKCDSCERSFTQSHSLERHIKRIHTDKDTIVVANDEIEATDNPIQIDKKSGQKYIKYICDICEKLFNKSNTLKYHMNHVHESEKRSLNYTQKNPAANVEKSAVYDQNLAQKIVIHEGIESNITKVLEGPKHHTESNANKTSLKIKKADNLDSPRRIVKTYGRFNQGKASWSHKNIIQGKIKKYSCTICDKIFSFDKILKNHIQIMHKKDRTTTHEGHKDYKCKHCGKLFSQAQHLKGHINTMHESHKDYEFES